jgi:hypothetical protein
VVGRSETVDGLPTKEGDIGWACTTAGAELWSWNYGRPYIDEKDDNLKLSKLFSRSKADEIHSGLGSSAADLYQTIL